MIITPELSRELATLFQEKNISSIGEREDLTSLFDSIEGLRSFLEKREERAKG